MKRAFKSMLSWVRKKLEGQNIIDGKLTKAANVLIEGTEVAGNLYLGDSTKLHCCHVRGEVTIGKFTSLWGPNISVQGQVTIGSYCSIAHGVAIISYSHNLLRPSTYYLSKNLFRESDENEIIKANEVVIGNDVWIGAGAQILPGVRVGHGAVIGAGAIVTKDVAPYSIVGGNPAKMIRMRFDQSIVDQLLKISWWDWSEKKMKANKAFFRSDLTLESFEKIIEL